MAGSMRYAVLLLLGLLILLSTLSLRPAGEGALVVGDGADALADAAARTEDPRVTVVLLRRWANLRHFPEIDCGRHCDGRAEVVVITAPRLDGWRKTMLIDVSEAGGALDAGEGLPDRVAQCVAWQVVEEVARRDAAAACGWARAGRWDLPFGL